MHDFVQIFTKEEEETRKIRGKINQITDLNGQINANIIYHTLDIISNTFASDTDYLFCNYGEHCRNQPES